MTEKQVKNILLIGRTGTGKSTLANVLVNKNGNFAEVFKESEASTSETKHYQRELIDVNGKNYGVVDTIGLGDTKLRPTEVYSRLAEAIREFFKQDGINRVIFTTDGRFTKEEITAFASLQLALFDEEIVKHCTIVRTKFPEFNNKAECSKDIQRLRNENSELEELITSIGPMNIIHTDAERTYEGYEKDWKELNKRLWDYLERFEADKYIPKGMEDLNKKIDQLLAEEQKKQESLQNKIDGLKEEAKKETTNKAMLEQELEEVRRRIEEEHKKLEERRQKEQELARKREEDLRKEMEESLKRLEKEREKREEMEEKYKIKLEEERKERERREKELEEANKRRLEEERKEREKKEREIAEANKKIEEAQRESERINKENERLATEIKKQQGQILEKHGDDSLGTFIKDYSGAVDKGVETGRKAIPLVGGFVGGAIAFVAGLPFLGVKLFKSLFWN